MQTFDWIVVGAGLAGSALGYELTKAGFSVLMLDQSASPASATRYSYGGIAYWSAVTPPTQQLCQESIAIHRNLSAELEADTQFRELDLLLTIAPDRDPETVAASYCNCMIPPQLISVDIACDIEPLLNQEAIAAALHVKHGHVEPELTAKAYREAMMRLGGKYEIATVQGFVREGDQIHGVVTPTGTYAGQNVAVCVGGVTRPLVRSLGIAPKIYFTQAEVIDIPPSELHLNSLVMPAELQRFEMEAKAGKAAVDPLWDLPGNEIAPMILDVGAIQFLDGRIRVGQVSRAVSDVEPVVDAAASAAALQAGVGRVLPALKSQPSTWGRCVVAFSGDRLPLVGTLPQLEGLHLFSGFSNPFALLPAIARRYARHVTGTPDDLLAPFSPTRFGH